MILPTRDIYVFAFYTNNTRSDNCVLLKEHLGSPDPHVHIEFKDAAQRFMLQS